MTDVAEAVDDVENVKQAAWMNETPAVIMNIQRQPGANVIEVVDRIKKVLPALQSSLPPAVKVSVLTDRTTTIRASVRDVQVELILAVALVILVIFLFLRNLPATTIPSVAVPLSIVGTFGVMYLMDFGLNNLTLMALTIATGFVVDDAIVMIENIGRYIEAGEQPLAAALKGSKQIGFTILSLTVSLIAVLIPLLFMGDVVGRLFREFAITLGVTIIISAVVSLTLTPMMCARILKHTPQEKQGRVFFRLPAPVRPDHSSLREIPATGPTSPDGDAWCGLRDHCTDRLVVHGRAQRFLPCSGHGGHSGNIRGPAIDLLSRNGERAAGIGPDYSARSGSREPFLLHRH